MRKKSEMEKQCKCGNEATREWHVCPYQQEINDNDEPEFCDCCSECEQNCREDI